MFSSAYADIVTDASGDATVYLTHGNNRSLNGFVYLLKYTPGTIDAGAVLTITGEDSGIPILTKTGAGASNVFYYPRTPNNAVADGAVNSCPTDLVPVKDERMKVIVSQGGNTGAGVIEVILLVRSPY